MNMSFFSKFKSEVGMKAMKFLPVSVGCLVAVMSGTVGAASVDLSPVNKETMRDTTDYYNIKVPNSSLALSFSSSFTVGWDSNIGRSGYGSNPNSTSGWYMQPGLSMGVNWPLTTFAKIHSAVGVGYRFYPDGSGENDLILSGDGGGISTGIELELKLGQNGKLTVGDNISRTIDNLQMSAQNSGVSGYSATENETFAQYQNDLRDDLHLYARYAHTMAWYSPGEYKYMNFQSDMIDTLLMKDLTKGWSVGPYATASTTYYSEKDPSTNAKRNDNTDYRLGMAFRHIGNVTLDGRVGAQFMNFQNDNKLAKDDSVVTPTYQLHATFNTGDFLTHTLSHSYESTTSYRKVSINYAKQFSTAYAITYRVHRDIDLGADASWLSVTESDGGENYDMLRLGVGPTYNLSRNTSLSARYEYTTKFSGSGLDEYERHVVSATVTHKF